MITKHSERRNFASYARRRNFIWRNLESLHFGKTRWRGKTSGWKGSKEPGTIFKNKPVEKSLVESLQKETTTTVTRLTLMSKDVNKFGTLPFNSALQSAIASRRNEEIESYRRWMLIESTFQCFDFFLQNFFSTASRNLRWFLLFLGGNLRFVF